MAYPPTSVQTILSHQVFICQPRETHQYHGVEYKANYKQGGVVHNYNPKLWRWRQEDCQPELHEPFYQKPKG